MHRALGDQRVAVIAEVIDRTTRLEPLQLLMAVGAECGNPHNGLAVTASLLLAAGIQFALAGWT